MIQSPIVYVDACVVVHSAPVLVLCQNINIATFLNHMSSSRFTDAYRVLIALAAPLGEVPSQPEHGER
jgi:hypothetical protein